MANCKSRCNFYFKVQGCADLGRCGRQISSILRPARRMIRQYWRDLGRFAAGAPLAAPAGVLAAARASGDHRRPAPNLVADRPGRARRAPARGDSPAQHRAPAYRCPHCFREPQSPLLRQPYQRCPGQPPQLPHCFREPRPPGRRDSRPRRMCLGPRHHARYRLRRGRRASVVSRSINQALNHGICRWLIIADHMRPSGHYSACVTRRPDAASGLSRGAQICHRIAAYSPQRDA